MPWLKLYQCLALGRGESGTAPYDGACIAETRVPQVGGRAGSGETRRLRSGLVSSLRDVRRDVWSSIDAVSGPGRLSGGRGSDTFNGDGIDGLQITRD